MYIHADIHDAFNVSACSITYNKYKSYKITIYFHNNSTKSELLKTIPELIHDYYIKSTCIEKTIGMRKL